MSFQQISIRNFRAIASLEIDNIKQVNLLTGKNNCGKTSVLEAISLLVWMSYPQAAVTVHNWRGLVLNNDKDFSYLFHGFDFSRSPSLTGREKSRQRTLDIKPVYPASAGTVGQIPGQYESPESGPVPGASLTGDVPGGLAFDFGVDGKPFHAEMKIIQGTAANYPGAGGQVNVQQVNVQSEQNYRESLRANFINPATITAGLYQRIEAILVRKESGGIINALREIEPNLQDIRLGTGQMIYADIAGMGRLVPINIMGDGISKILAILSAILETKGGILLIDEIENGLHYSALVPLWRAIFKMARESNTQLFIATHSYECIGAMTEVYRDMGLGEDFISSYRIDRDAEGQHRAFQYEPDALLFAMKNNFEVR
uniref:ATPase/GTPase, AAA15 family n=1 Tax=Candidatus Kentrum sp. DK TaxID=2126562 RepID=A0A450S5J1_9GAMM|nr:MAG: ATPase/GTPase, AAA15 family [Candidatus Kentron sp. DK]VFJ61044.1 MAG: ATPase/GTPase, AAA15 family [Candidatus Kentron sp. DK]